MAQDKHSRTEAPTPRRREESRKKGDVALSRDLVAGFGLLAAVLMFYFLGPEMGSGLIQLLRSELSGSHFTDLNSQHVVTIARSSFGVLARVIGMLIVGLAVVHAAVSVLQTGWNLTLQPLSPNWERINPIQGWTRLWSVASLNRGVQAVAKTTILVTVMVLAARTYHERIQWAPLEPLTAIVALTWDITLRSSFIVGIALVVAGTADYGFQYWRHETQLRMTREEVKDERKQDEGDPLLRARIRRVQRDLSRQRMLRSVPGATVVITNPTHYAIALKYELGEMDAPKVVAKGVDKVALRIRQIAGQHNVPILERPALARSLYRMVDIGDEIPPDLYQAVSEIIAYLYKLGRFR